MPPAPDRDALLLSALYDGVGRTDGWDRFVEALIGEAASADILLSKPELLKTEFYADWLRPQGLLTRNTITVQRDKSRFMVVTVLYPEATAEKDLDAGVPSSAH
jgi:hypothetical protein